jgi:hypothetical protein
MIFLQIEMTGGYQARLYFKLNYFQFIIYLDNLSFL